MSLEVGQLVDNKYRIIRMIGEGGMGAVFEGENVRINRRVAIKILHAAFAGNTEVMQRFEREAQAAGRIGNDHILEVLDLGVLPDGDRYIIMEFLEGDPLSNRIRQRGRLMPHELAPIIRQVLVGLGAAHAVGIVHRDLKPDNIFIQREKAGNKDFVKIIDFGISKFQPLSGDGMKMTRTGAVMGTPYYMSPEQASGSGEADARSDVYSIGVIMYEAVTGQVPFDAGTFNQLMFKIVLAEVPPPQATVPDLDPAFASIISKTMARDVAQRFQSTAEVIQALDAWLRTGKAVTVPPANAEGSAGHLPQGARGALTSVAEAQPTPATAGSWATSQPGAAAPKKSAAPVIALVLGLGLLVLAGGAFAAYALHNKLLPSASSAASTTAPAQSAVTEAKTPPVVVPAPVVASAVTAPAAGTVPAPAPASAAVAVATASVAVVAPTGAAAHVPAARAAVAPSPKAAAAAKPEGVEKPAPAVPAKPANAPDFGY